MLKITSWFIVPLLALNLSTPVAAESAMQQAWILSKDQVDVGSQTALMDQLSSPTNRLAQVKNKYFVELKAQELKNLKRGDALAVPLPNGLQNFVVTKRELNSSGTQSLTARSQNLVDGDFVIITLGENIFHLTAQGNSVLYTGRGADSVGLLVAENDYKELIPGLGNEFDEREAPRGSLQNQISEHLWQGKRPEQTLSAQELVQEQSDETAIIDVLFYYTPSTNALYDNNPQSRIDHIVTITNFIFSNSNVNAQIRGTSQEIDYVESTVSKGLEDMTYERNGFENIDDDRFLAGADAVALLHPIVFEDPACGIAYLVDPRSVRFRQISLSANGIDCQDYVFAHELGHNLGLSHSRRQGSSGAAFDYGVGHGVDDVFHTVMAYRSAYDTSAVGSPSTEYLFSSPELTCGADLPCGIPEGEPDSADAARALRAVVAAAASAYDPEPDTTLATDAIENIVDPNLRACLKQNEERNSNRYAAGWTRATCYGFPVSDLSGLEQFKNLEEFSVGLDADIDLSVFANMYHLHSLALYAIPSKRGQLSISNLNALADKTRLLNIRLEYLDITDLDFLTNLTQLKAFSLIGTQIADFSPLFDLTQITYLSLSLTNFPAEQISNLSSMTQLSYLTLVDNGYTDLDGVVFPTSIEYLSLNNNKLESAPNLDPLDSLVNLNLLYNPLTNFDGLAGAESLRILDLRYTAVQNLQTLSAMPQITTLYLAGTEINSIEVIADINYLVHFDASDTLVSDIGPALLHLSRLDPVKNWGGAFNFQSLRIPCWQQVYGELFDNDGISVYFDNSECFTNDDYADYDGDGIANIVEVNFGLNPLSSDSNGDGIDDTLASSISLDADGDGKADLFVRNTDTFFNYGFASEKSDIKRVVLGKNSKDIPVFGDFDGDGRTDIGVRRPSTSMWYVKSSSTPGMRGDFIQRIKFGLAPEDMPVLADYDGDGITDFAVYRPSNHIWYIKPSSGGDIMEMSVGANDGDIPVTGDFDGDGKADIAIRRPSTHTWHILRSSDGQEQVITFGLAEEDIPVPADYDGDGITDLAVRRPSTQMWYILNSSGEPGPFGDGIQRIRFGLDPADIPIVDDYDGDGKADIAVRRASTQMQYILTSSGEGGDRGDGIMRVRFGLQEKYVPFQAPIHIRMQMVEAANER